MRSVLVVNDEVAELLGGDEGVPVLDPAAGAGSFLKDTLERLQQTLKERSPVRPSEPTEVCVGNPPYARRDGEAPTNRKAE